MADQTRESRTTDSSHHKIFLMGLTSAPMGSMEYNNLGNYLIVEPLFENLRINFPESEIRTTLQLTKGFCERFGIVSLPHERFWTYEKRTLITTIGDVVILIFWYLLKFIVSDKAKTALNKSVLLRELYNADIILDFSGDLYGDNVNGVRLLEASTKMLFARILGKPVMMFVSSPGPFNKAAWRRNLARFVINHIRLIVNREPMSTELLRKFGVDSKLLRTTACPSFLFKGEPELDIATILKEEGIHTDEPVVGVIICGWNMPSPPFNKVPRETSDLQPFLPALRYLLDETPAQVVLMSHSHRINSAGQLIPGPDAIISEQIFNLLGPESYPKKLVLVRGAYTTATTKAIIRSFDMLISGRLHGSISGMSQYVPTVILDYGCEPKAHKLRGMAQMLGVEALLCDPANAQQMKTIVADVWENRTDFREKLIPNVQKATEMAASSFDLVRYILENSDALLDL